MGKKLGLTGLIAGLVLALYGLSQIRTYTEEKFDQSKSRPGMFGGRDDMSNYLELQMRNQDNQARAEISIQRNQPYVVYGGIVALAGALLLALSVVQNRALSTGAAQGVPASGPTAGATPQDPAAVAATPLDWRCPQCGAPQIQTENRNNIVCQNMHMTARS